VSDRRQALLGAAALAVLGGTGLSLWRERGRLPEGDPIRTAPGFRRFPGASQGVAPMAGLTAGPSEQLPDLTTAELCAGLFRDSAPGPVPVASFSDFYCPNCSEMHAALGGLSPSVSVTLHEWPVFGARSEYLARVALAAGMQGAHAEMNAALLRRRAAPTPSGARAAAEDLDLDADRLLADMERAEIDAQLAETAALARVLGLVGTPSLVIGDMVVTGLPGQRVLAALARGRRAPCA
jgi:protein-disulfide isomerase